MKMTIITCKLIYIVDGRIELKLARLKGNFGEIA